MRQEHRELIQRAEKLADASRWEECIALCEQVLIEDSENPGALNLKGFCLVGLDRVQDALPFFKLARLYLPMYQPFRYNLARALQDTGDLRGALSEFDEAIKLDRSDTRALMFRSVVRHDLGDRDGALQDMEECLRLQPDNPRLWLARASLRLDLGERGAAASDLKKALELDRGCRAQALPLIDALGDPTLDPAERDMDKSLRQGEVWADEGRWAEALAIADAMLKRAPGSARAAALRGRALTGTGLHDEAEKVLLEAIGRSPGEAQLHRLLAEARLRREDLWGALKAYDGALAAAPEDGESLRGRAALKMRLGDPEGAQSDLDRLKAAGG